MANGSQQGWDESPLSEIEPQISAARHGIQAGALQSVTKSSLDNEFGQLF
jgi:hypothetical protein